MSTSVATYAKSTKQNNQSQQSAAEPIGALQRPAAPCSVLQNSAAPHSAPQRPTASAAPHSVLNIPAILAKPNNTPRRAPDPYSAAPRFTRPAEYYSVPGKLRRRNSPFPKQDVDP